MTSVNNFSLPNVRMVGFDLCRPSLAIPPILGFLWCGEACVAYVPGNFK